jgi:hypothetical protein
MRSQSEKKENTKNMEMQVHGEKTKKQTKPTDYKF